MSGCLIFIFISRFKHDKLKTPHFPLYFNKKYQQLGHYPREPRGGGGGGLHCKLYSIYIFPVAVEWQIYEDTAIAVYTHYKQRSKKNVY
jgi:hypothetical protein